MEYRDEFRHLNSILSYDGDEIEIDEKTIFKNFDYESKAYSILPGGVENRPCDGSVFNSEEADFETDAVMGMLHKNDSEISENIRFRYHLMMPAYKMKAKDVLFLFHGFNEKYWAKYFPWAKYIVEKTGKAVLFFPIAFHMNRAPATWSETRKMYVVSEKRKIKHPYIIGSSLANVAISTRLDNNPKRLIWSGLQTYYDVMDFIKTVKENRHPAIHTDAKFDIFSYSIGTLLAEILMMTNTHDYFSDSRLVSFCGGAAFNRITPVSKSILDSQANVRLYSHVVEQLDSHLKSDEALRRYLGGDYAEGVNFRSMLNYNMFIDHREEKFRQISDRTYAIVLKEDKVMQPYEVINTLQGTKRDIPIKVDVLDFPYKYTHEEPFPQHEKIQAVVSEHFRKTFDLVCDFLN